jgi:hypothetical protein
MSFDLRDYITVRERMVAFYKRYPEGSLEMDPVDFQQIEGKMWAIGRAYAYRTPDDPRPGVGTAWEIVPGLTPYTRGSEVQNLETSCWGRALAAIGIGIEKGVATADEVRAAKHREGAYERLSSTPEDDPFYTQPEPRYEHNKPHFARRINDKQKGLLRGKLDKAGITGDQVIPTINAILGAAGQEPVTLPAELTNNQLDLVLKGLENVTTVEEYLSEAP